MVKASISLRNWTNMADMAVVIGTKARTVAILEGHFVLIVAMLLFLLLVSL